MPKKRSPRSGFRTFETDALHYQNQYFWRFIHKYPQALEELREMLPLFQSIFGPPAQIDVTKDLLKTHLFDDKFLLQPEEMLLRCHQGSNEYGLHSFRRSRITVPDFITVLPDDYVNKGNENYYKSVIETGLVWEIAELRAKAGDSALLNHLKEREEFTKNKRREITELIGKICAEKQLELSEDDMSFQAYKFTGDFLKSSGFYQDEETDSLIENYWVFYEKFHAWIAKYHLYRAWLRRSFFIALLRGLTVFWADVSASVHLPTELTTELYGEPNDLLNFSFGSLPTPEPFKFEIVRYSPGITKPVWTEQKWKTDPYWIFDSPSEYKEKVVEEFKTAVGKVPFFESENKVVEPFSAFIAEAVTEEAAESGESITNDFRNYLRRFSFFREILENRSRIVETYEKHIQIYLDGILPVIGKYFRTREGAPPKFERLDWLLDWNVENLTARKIVEKYELSDESTFRKALNDFKAYNLPVKEKANKIISWNDEWFLKRLNAGFPDRKKLVKNSPPKN